MRVVFQDGIIYASYTDKEVENMAKHKHALVEMTPQEFRSVSYTHLTLPTTNRV